MVYPNAYINFLIHFHGDRDYFECHEILEEYWKQTEPGNRHSIWVGFIQLAVAQYHYRRGNIKGAKKLIIKSIEILKQRRIEIIKLGINDLELFMLLNELKNEYQNGHVYKSINLPIFNSHLLNICKKECLKLGLHWCNSDDLVSDFIIHRHLHRNRSGIELERSSLSKTIENNNYNEKIYI